MIFIFLVTLDVVENKAGARLQYGSLARAESHPRVISSPFSDARILYALKTLLL